MKFKQFLSESTNALTEQTLAPFKQNIITMFEQKKYIYRSQDYGEFKVDPETKMTWSIIKERTSRRNSVGGNNFLMYVSSKWDDFPDRSYSYFASQTLDVSMFTGGRYLIVPADSINNYGFSEVDFNFDDEHFKKQTIHSGHNRSLISIVMYFLHMIHDTLPKHNKNFAALYNKHKFNVNKASNEKANHEIPGYITLVDELLQTINFEGLSSLSEYLKGLKDDLLKNGFKTVSELIDSYSPELHGIKAYSDIKSIPHCSTKYNEIWFVGSYLAIEMTDAVPAKESLEDLYYIAMGEKFV